MFRDIEQQIVAGYHRGVSNRALARRFGICAQSVANALRRNGITRLQNAPAYTPTPVQIEEAAIEVRAGWDEATRMRRLATQVPPVMVTVCRELPSSRSKSHALTTL